MRILSIWAWAAGIALAPLLLDTAHALPETRGVFEPRLFEVDSSDLLQPTVIRVQQTWVKKSLKIQISSPLKLEWLPEGGKLMRESTLSSRNLDLELQGHQIKVSSGAGSALTTKLSLTGLGMKVDGVNWPRRVDVVPGAGTNLSVIYHMNLEDYVAKVLPHEMSLSWPEEALKAQAIAIRTYASFQMQRNRNRPYHIYSTTKDQVFKMEEVPAAWRSKLARIVEHTKGKVLRDSKGKVASIFYHADCGGSAERSPWVWNEHSPSGAPIQCAHHPSLSWKLAVSDEELVRKLSRGHSKISGHIDGVSPVKRSASGRVEELSIHMASGASLNLRPEVLRMALGPDQLKSARFTVRAAKDGVEFIGHGYGHGVGLCQRGSKAWAEQGKESSEILKIYYPALTIAPPAGGSAPSNWAAR